MSQFRMTSLIGILVFLTQVFFPTGTPPHSLAQDPDVAPSETPKKYSDSVVAKAETILKENGLQRSGKALQSLLTKDISREVAGLTKKRRDLSLQQKDWQSLVLQLMRIRTELRKLNAQDIDLNLQLARLVGGDVATNNRLIALINATRAKTRQLREQYSDLEKPLAAARAQVNQSESDYAERVLAIRRDFDALVNQIDKSLSDDQVKIAVGVMHANFGSPKDLDAETVLAALAKRIEKIEKEIFRETIQLDVQGGAMYVNVVVGDKSSRMLVDSGATMISLPAATATQLGVTVPEEARRAKLVMADGREISARIVTLDRVRVGQFEAHDVDAAVLDANAINAEPLLGMSFLGNFKFSLDRDEKTLKIMRVSIP